MIFYIFIHSTSIGYGTICICSPEYDLLWKQFGRQKYKYYATLETLIHLDKMKEILSSWKDKTRAMRSACTILTDSKLKDIDATGLITKLMDSLIMALRSQLYP